MKKLPVTFFIILFAVLLVGAAYLYIRSSRRNPPSFASPPVTTPSPPAVSPRPDSVSGWEKYATTLYSVQYPADVSVRQEAGGSVSLYKWGPTQKEGTELYDGFAVTFQPREISDTTLLNYVRNLIEETKKNGVSRISSGPDPVTVNGYQGYKYVEEGLGSYDQYILVSPDKSAFMAISVIVADPGNLNFQITVDRILSTFSFQAGNSAAGQVCGGPYLTPCPSGYTCRLKTVTSGELDETSGVCVRN